MKSWERAASLRNYVNVTESFKWWYNPVIKQQSPWAVFIENWLHGDSTEVPRDAGPLVRHYLLLVFFYTHCLLFLQCPGFSAEMLFKNVCILISCLASPSSTGVWWQEVNWTLGERGSGHRGNKLVEWLLPLVIGRKNSEIPKCFLTFATHINWVRLLRAFLFN